MADRAAVGAHRRAYAGEVAAWLGWLVGRDTGVLAAGHMHVDLWAAIQLDAGTASRIFNTAAPDRAELTPKTAAPRRPR